MNGRSHSTPRTPRCNCHERPWAEHRCKYVALSDHILTPVHHMEIDPPQYRPDLMHCKRCGRGYEPQVTGRSGLCPSCASSAIADTDAFMAEFGIAP